MTRAAPAGAEVGIYVDLREPVYHGDVIETRSGRRYGVLAIRVQERGKHAGRQHLRAVVLGADGEPAAIANDGHGAERPGKVHRIRWYRRGRASGGVKPKGVR